MKTTCRRVAIFYRQISCQKVFHDPKNFLTIYAILLRREKTSKTKRHIKVLIYHPSKHILAQQLRREKIFNDDGVAFRAVLIQVTLNEPMS